MRDLHRQVRRARARLLAQSFLRHLGWSLFAALSAGAVSVAGVLLAERLWQLGDARTWAAAAMAVALVAGVAAAAVWTWLGRESTLSVATEIDLRCGLKERISSTLALSDEESATPIGQALVRDTLARVDRIDVPHQFPVRLERPVLLPILPGAAALALVALLGVPPRVAPPTATAAETAQIKKSVENLAKKLEEQRKEATDSGLKDEDEMLARLLQGAKDLAEKTPADRKQALVALNDLVKEAEKRRQQLAASSDLKEQLNQLKNFQPGPAQKMANALKSGDLKKAMDEMRKLEEKLAGDRLTPMEKQDLAKQLEQMQQSLEKTVESHKEAQRELVKKVEEQRRAGNAAEAEKLQKQLDKLAEKSQQMQKLDAMQAHLKQAAQAMKNGDREKAAEALAEMRDQLKDMAQDMEQMALLDDAMESLEACKSGMCKNDGGEEGQEGNGGQGMNMRFGDRIGRGDFARGGGRASGKREKEEGDASFVDSQVSQNVRRGPMVLKGTADGPNRKGQVQEAIKEEFAGAMQEAAEALSEQKLPHEYRDHTRSYFEALREAGR